jgi:antitoxin (DNA-binding transcriptional repressor) of toxin-antitoxin stability system
MKFQLALYDDVKDRPMPTVTIDEATQKLPDLIAAALRGEVVYITDEQHKRIRLTPVRGERQPRKAGSARGQITMAADFDITPDDFSEYLS